MYIRTLLFIVGLGVCFATIPALVMTGTGASAVDVAHAQVKKKKRRSLLQILFGKPKTRTRAKISTRTKKRSSKKSRRKKTAVASAPTVQPVQKNPDAKVVLVAGDFLANGLHWGLERAFAEQPALRFVKLTKGSSGLVREDHYDWPGTIGETVKATSAAAVVVMLGTNDRQQMRVAGTRHKRSSEAWLAEYKTRANRLAKGASDNGVPLIWVGLPPMRRKSMSADFLVANEIFRTATERVGGTFVDIWVGFTDENGNYSRSGPNVTGQITTLRGSDGINVSRQGMRKMAFYVEKPIKRAIGIGTTGLLLSALPGMDIQREIKPEYDPAKTGETIVIPLNAPVADGGGALEGGADFVVGVVTPNSNSHQMVVNGERPSPPLGRADYFTLKPDAGAALAGAEAASSTQAPTAAN